jgi:hypothetical protein
MNTNNIRNINIGYLDPHPQNPRQDLGDLTELADSSTRTSALQAASGGRNGLDLWVDWNDGAREHLAVSEYGEDYGYKWIKEREDKK